jgi:hypothetical protein
MNSQIFKNAIPNSILFNFLDKVCIKNNKYYTINKIVFKKALYNNYFKDFIEECRPYYYLSKQIYLNEPFTYNKFVTIIRQICKHKTITHTSHIKYDKSVYEIIYYVYYNM